MIWGDAFHRDKLTRSPADKHVCQDLQIRLNLDNPRGGASSHLNQQPTPRLGTAPPPHPSFTKRSQLRTIRLIMSGNQESLRSLYDSGERLRKEIEDSYDYNSPAYQQRLQTAIRTFRECENLVDQISLFSVNESLEDVVSSEIR